MIDEAGLDIAAIIGNQAKVLARLIADIDEYSPDEGAVEVLLYSFQKWGSIETAVLFPALEQYADGSEAIVDAALKRLEVLDGLQANIHLYEGADAPFSELAAKFIAAVKYHLIVDVQDILPLTLQIPELANDRIALQMRQYQANFSD